MEQWFYHFGLIRTECLAFWFSMLKSDEFFSIWIKEKLISLRKQQQVLINSLRHMMFVFFQPLNTPNRRVN